MSRAFENLTSSRIRVMHRWSESRLGIDKKVHVILSLLLITIRSESNRRLWMVIKSTLQADFIGQLDWPIRKLDLGIVALKSSFFVGLAHVSSNAIRFAQCRIALRRPP